jgi:hypothetical protein
MANAGLGIRQRSVLLILMAEAAEVANPDLHARYGVRLDGADRRRLNDLGLVTSRRVGRSLAHELTDKGWRWCADELAAGLPARAGSAGGALYAVLGGLGRYLGRAGLSLADVFAALPAGGPPPAAAPPAPAAPVLPAAATTTSGGDVEARVRDAYRRVVAKPRDWASLADVRPLLGDLDRSAVDAALARMYRQAGVSIAAEPNRKALAPADHAAAVHIGGEDKHLLAIEGP